MRHLRLALPLVLLLASQAGAVPLQLAHQGRLLDAGGAPLEGAHDVALTLYDAPAGGAVLWTETASAEFENGFFAVRLGADGSNPLDDATFAGDSVWLGLSVDGGAELPDRIALASVPFAVRAGTATNLAGGVVDATEIRVGGVTVIDGGGIVPGADSDTLADLADACAEGQLVTFDGAAFACADPAPHAHDAADLTSGTISSERLPVGTSAADVAAGDHAHTAADVGALPVEGGELTGALEGTTAAFSGSVQVGASSAKCDDPSQYGAIRFTGDAFEGCSEKGWIVLARAITNDGSSEADAGETCKTILGVDKSAKDGVYWVDPDGVGGLDAWRTYCDMTTDGGGWTLAGWSFAGATSTNDVNHGFRSLKCGGGTYDPEKRGQTSAAIGAVPLVKKSTEMAVSMSIAGGTILTGGIRAYDRGYKFSIPDPSAVHFNNHSYRGSNWNTGATGVGSCVPVTVTGIHNDTFSGTKYTLKHVLGTSWTDSYPTGYGVSNLNSCVNHDGGPFLTSIHTGHGGGLPAKPITECDVVNGAYTYTHRGNYAANQVNTTGSAAIWFR